MGDFLKKAGWHVTSAEKAGFDASCLEVAVKFAIENESIMKRDIKVALAEGYFGEPWPIGQTIGPVKDREGPSGIILRNGSIVKGVVRQSLTRAQSTTITQIYEAQKLNHSMRAVVRFCLNDCLLSRCLS
jgi:hypothetical protein